MSKSLGLLLAFLVVCADAPATAASREFYVELRAGLARHDLADVHEQLLAVDGAVVVDRFTGPAAGGAGDNPLHTGLAAGLSAGFRLDERWWLGLGVDRLDVRDRSDGFLGGSAGALDLSGWALVGRVGREVGSRSEVAAFVPAVEVGVLVPGADVTDLGIRTGGWTERAIPVATALLGAHRWLAHDALVAVELGYRVARDDGAAADPAAAAPGPETVDLDYSGVVFRVGVRLVR